jgi:hypothetical protein
MKNLRRLVFLLGTPAWIIAYLVTDALLGLKLEILSTPEWVWELRWHPYPINWAFIFVDRLCVLALLSLPYSILVERFYGRYALYIASIAAVLIAYGQATIVVDQFNLPAQPVHHFDWIRIVPSLVVLPALVISIRRLRSNNRLEGHTFT